VNKWGLWVSTAVMMASTVDWLGCTADSKVSTAVTSESIWESWENILGLLGCMWDLWENISVSWESNWDLSANKTVM